MECVFGKPAVRVLVVGGLITHKTQSKGKSQQSNTKQTSALEVKASRDP